MPAWQVRLAHVNPPRCSTSALFTMPLAGYLGSRVQRVSRQALRHDAAHVGLEGLGAEGRFQRATTSGRAGCSLFAVALHLAGALKHILVDRDGLLSRMGVGKGESMARSAVRLRGVRSDAASRRARPTRSILEALALLAA